ncbi:MAG: ChaN family lipoprotein [Thermoguttaceae bacterium]
MRHRTTTAFRALPVLFLLAGSAVAEDDTARSSQWIDIYFGEPVAYETMLWDLVEEADVIYLGEFHTLDRHHAMQTKIVSDLAKQDVSLVLGIEQMEADRQPALDRYYRGEIDFDQLAEQTEWADRWNGYEQYRSILEATRAHGGQILALNARKETIRQVARSGGVDGLDAEMRKELPAEMQLEDPLYAKLLDLQMMVHMSVSSERLRPIREAQIARDEMMASVLCSFLQSPEGKGRTAVVICGAGHVSYGLGMPDRVRRRMPHLKQRIVLISESGDVELSDAQKAAMREITITHEQIREINRPIADYLHVTSLKSDDDSQED